MCSPYTFTESLFSLRKLEDFITADHSLRAIPQMANTALEKMNGLFTEMYEAATKGGRPRMAPEKLLRGHAIGSWAHNCARHLHKDELQMLAAFGSRYCVSLRVKKGCNYLGLHNSFTDN